MLYTSLLYTAQQVRELDRRAIAGLPDIGEAGIPGIQLMKRAGKSVLATVLECWPHPEHITVYCGSGNNGGDGYIVAALAQLRQIPVTVIQVGDHRSLQGDARLAYDFAKAQSVGMFPFDKVKNRTLEQGVIVDALLGIGFIGALRAPFDGVIAQINRSALPVVAVDIPSGLNSDSGCAGSPCVKADLTVSFIGLKRGLFTADGPEHCGEIFFDDLDVPPEIYESVPAEVKKLDLDALLELLPARARNTHKGHYGHVLVVGGDGGYGGAVLMAAETAARCGAGLVSVATQAEHIPALLARCPEVMGHAVENHHSLLPLLQKASVIVIGPGLGATPWSEQLLYHTVQYARANDTPLVMDADALNLLALGRVVKALPGQVLLTPHPGEAARLLATDTGHIQRDRFAAAKTLQEKYGATVVLKGAGTLIAASGLSLCPYGNPAMATGGMGDVLSGVLGGLLAQHLSLQQAAELAVCLHGRAADILADEKGERGLLATDLIPVIHRLMNGME
jgi:ADP-dependent NAD(P)H-hydrate dehydratase / NAD(P)H-hydrate epimerase